MKFSTKSLFSEFDENEKIRKVLEKIHFPHSVSIHPPVAELKPFGMITRSGDDYETTQFELKDIFTTPAPFSFKTKRSYLNLPPNTPHTPYLSSAKGFPYLEGYLQEMGASDVQKIMDSLNENEELAFSFFSLRKIEARTSFSDLQNWVARQTPDFTHNLLQDLRNGKRIYMAFTTGSVSRIRIDFKDTAKEDIENSSGDVRTRFSFFLNFF
ncbi:MAG: hypothetical protein AAFR87_35805 [Bacteroidota bacterium]